mgnify:CR=1 FL=1
MFYNFKEDTTFREQKCSVVNIPLQAQQELLVITISLLLKLPSLLWGEVVTLEIHDFISATVGLITHHSM